MLHTEMSYINKDIKDVPDTQVCLRREKYTVFNMHV